MEKKFLVLESALNTIININIGKETRLQELAKIEEYAAGLINLPEDKMDMLKSVIEVFRNELKSETINEECIGGYNKMLKERLSINRNLRSQKCVIYGNNWLAEDIAKNMRSKSYCVFNWQTVNPAYIDEYDLYILCDDPLKAYDLASIKNRDKIIKMWDYLKYKFVVFPTFYKTYVNFKRQSGDKVKCVITGNSNIVHAVHSNLLHVKSVSVANNAQDIFYDFKMFCHACETMPNIEYAIIGLVPFSLRYDASKSKVEWRRCLVYYPIVESMHNYEDREHLMDLFHAQNAKIKQIFEDEYMRSLYGLYEKQVGVEPDNGEDVFNEKTRTQENTALNLREISELYNRPFTDILLENKVLLEEYARFCARKGIKPIFFIPPYTEWYKENMRKSYYEELVNTINALCTKYSAKFINMMDVELPDGCFRDYANINNLGAVKVASYINHIIEN